MIRRKIALPDNIDDDKPEFGLPDIGIPAEVLFNPDLTHSQKILFGFIRNLAQTEKGCWASNRYLARCLGLQKQSITNGVSKLRDYHYIKVQFLTLADGRQVRRIYVNELYPAIYAHYIRRVFKNLNKGVLRNLCPPVTELIEPYLKTYGKGVNKDVKESILEEAAEIKKDSKASQGYITPKDFDRFWELYPSKRKGFKGDARGSKGDALTKWETLCRNKEHRPTWKEIEQSIKKHMQGELWRDGYIPYVKTWLHNKRWLDNPEELKVNRFERQKEKDNSMPIYGTNPFYTD